MIENFIICLNQYIKTGKQNYFINEGEIEFYNKKDTHYNAIIITRFFLKEEYQKIGILINFLCKSFDEIWFTQCNAIMSCILLTTCLQNIYFINRYAGEHYWKKYNKTYNSDKCLEINNILLKLKTILKINYEEFAILANTEEYRFLL